MFFAKNSVKIGGGAISVVFSALRSLNFWLLLPLSAF